MTFAPWTRGQLGSECQIHSTTETSVQKMITTEARVQRSLNVAIALLTICALAVFGYQSLNDPLRSDELLTTHLLDAASLPKLWKGIALGIDGNPPLYLTAAWLIIQPLPKLVSSVVALKLVNLVVAAIGVAVLGRLARRLVSSAAAWIGALLFVTLSSGFIYDASVLRTYALYFLAAALAAFCQQRLIERRGSSDIGWLALANVALAMSHTFGIAYVGIIALAGWLSQPRGDRRLLMTPIVVAAIPAVLAVVAWSPFLLEQLQVAKPYSWIVSPGPSELLDTVFGSVVMLWISVFEAACLVAAGLSVLRQDKSQLRAMLHDPAGQPLRFVVLVLTGVTGFTFAGWLISRTLFPVFVVRFFAPQLFTAYALHVAFGEWLIRHRLQYRTAVVAICAVLAPLILGNVMFRAQHSVHGKQVCVDPDGRFFDESFVDGKLPVVVDSTHLFLPRLTYAAHGEAYRFPLDWDVVIKYPNRSRGNAVDFHLMQGLQTWKPLPQVETTEDILRTYPQFLVIEQRAWFPNLKDTHHVTAEKLAEVIPAAEDEIACTLWKVTRVEPRPQGVSIPSRSMMRRGNATEGPTGARKAERTPP